MEFEKIFVRSFIKKTFKILGSLLKRRNEVGSHLKILMEKITSTAFQG